MATPEENIAPAAPPPPAAEPSAVEALVTTIETATKQVETPKEVKEEKKGGAQDLKLTLLIPGAVVAVVGVVLAIVKKVKESAN